MNILYTVLFTFLKVVTRRICLTIKSFCISDSGVILYGELVASHPKGFKGEKPVLFLLKLLLLTGSSTLYQWRKFCKIVTNPSFAGDLDNLFGVALPTQSNQCLPCFYYLNDMHIRTHSGKSPKSAPGCYFFSWP